MHFFKKYYGLILILILSFWAVKSFFVSGFFPMHDDTQVARVFEMWKVLQNGIFPVRSVPDLGYGYGYPIFNFYAPLAYYIGAGLMFLGLDVLVATKLMMALGVISAGIFIYLLAREFFGELGGMVSGLFYLYAPYHAVDIYVRGDVAEFWSYAFIPLAFLGIYKKNILIGSVGFAAIILSHNLTAMMIVPFLLFVILLNCYIAFKNKKSFIFNHSSLILVFGLAISAFYWIPALLEIRNTNVFSQIGGGADFRDHFVCIGQLWNSAWGFGGSIPGCIDGLSFKLGKLNILSVFMVIVILIYLKFKYKYFNNTYYLSIFAIVGFLISVFLMLDMSKFVWEAVPAMAFFQYPWRFLLLASFFSSLLAGSLVYLLMQLKVRSYLIVVPLVFFLIFLNQKLFTPQTILLRTAEDYTNENALKWTASKISDEFLPPNFKKPMNQNDVYKGHPIVRVQETGVERISNVVSFVGLLALILGIIQYKKKYE